MSDLNLCQFIGRLARDPEVSYTPQGTAVANFTLAAGETWKDKNGQKQERVEWVRCVAWRRLAEIIGEYVAQGNQIYVSGKQQTRSWEDQNGNTKYVTEIIVSQMQMLGSKGGSSNNSGYNPSNKPSAPEPEQSYPDAGGHDDSNDVPF